MESFAVFRFNKNPFPFLSPFLLHLLCLSPNALYAETVKWNTESNSEISLVGIPYSCGNEVKFLSSVVGSYFNGETETSTSVSLFPVDPKDAVEVSDLKSLKVAEGDVFFKESSLTRGENGVVDLTSGPEGKFIDFSLKDIALLNADNLEVEGNEEKLARSLSASKGYDYDTLPKSFQEKLVKGLHATAKKNGEANLADKIKHTVDCGNGNIFEMELVSFGVVGLPINKEGKMESVAKNVVCKPEEATSMASCLEAYRKALIDFKNSGKPMFAFSGPSQNGNVAGGTPSPSTLSRHAEPGSPERPYTSNNTSGSRGMKQAGPGGSHFRRN